MVNKILLSMLSLSLLAGCSTANVSSKSANKTDMVGINLKFVSGEVSGKESAVLQDLYFPLGVENKSEISSGMYDDFKSESFSGFYYDFNCGKSCNNIIKLSLESVESSQVILSFKNTFYNDLVRNYYLAKLKIAKNTHSIVKIPASCEIVNCNTVETSNLKNLYYDISWYE